jgi:hypothetical protein
MMTFGFSAFPLASGLKTCVNRIEGASPRAQPFADPDQWAVAAAVGKIGAAGFLAKSRRAKGFAMLLLEIKLIATPVIMLAASLAARRWGDAIGGWLVGLPLTSGPISVFLAIERGPAFAAEAAAGSLAGVSAQAAFCLGYAALARRGLAAALIVGGLAFAASASALNALELPTAALFLLAIAALTLCLRLMPRRRLLKPVAAGPREILARMAVTTALVVGLTSAAAALGPRVSGAAASFPLIGASIAAFVHLSQGPAAGVAVMRGMAVALYAFAVFFLVAGLALLTASPLIAFGLATLCALVAQGATINLVRQPSEQDAAEAATAPARPAEPGA